MFDFAIIGKGLIGSAAGRYLSASGGKVAIIGPDEPQNWQTHAGVFASHYDQGRITRILDKDKVWATWAKRSIEQYAYLEEESGITFYHKTGGFWVEPPTADGQQSIAALEANGQVLGADFQTYLNSEADERTVSEVVAAYQFPAGYIGVMERGGAGYVNPRSLVAAQCKIAEKQGAAIIKETVHSLHQKQNSVEIKTVEGQTYQAHRVLLSAGGFANTLLERPLRLELRLRTILMAEVVGSELERLKDIPTLIYRFEGNPIILSIYMLPPVQYPDGKTYIKIGGNNMPQQIAETDTKLRSWFRAGGDQAEAEALKNVLCNIIPGLDIHSVTWKPCVTTYTPTDRPYLDQLDDNIFVAGPGNGAAAKSSNEIGRAGALLVEHGRWNYDMEAGWFKAQHS